MITCNATTLLKAASCISCLPSRKLSAIRTYIFCQLAPMGVGLNLIPTGSKYGGGATPEFDLTVLANTSYRIVWGTNDISMTLCGVNYPSTGAGTMTVVFTGACTTMQFFGTFAGTSVTAIVVVNRSIIPIPTGFTWALNVAGTQVVANWNNPNFLLVTYTELWTSPDGVTYSLAATVNFPTTTISFAAPANGTTLYAKIRWCGPTTPCGAFTPAQVVPQTQVASWAARVVINGGAVPSAASVSALDVFWKALKTAGLDSLMYHLNPIAPDSFIAARTPLVVGGFNDPWVDNSAGGSVSVNGIVTNNNLGSHYRPGNISKNFTLSSGGITLYIFSNVNVANNHDCGNNNTAFTDGSYMYVQNSGNTNGAIGSPTTSSIAVAFPGNGYFSMNRVSTTDLKLYWANSTNAHAQKAAGAVAAVTVLSPDNVFPVGGSYDFQTAAEGFLCRQRISFVATHAGLTQAQSSSFFNAIDALRVAFGGGRV